MVTASSSMVSHLRHALRALAPWATLMGGFVAACVWLPGFATPYNFVGLASDAAPLLIVVCVVRLCLRKGEHDLSVEGTASLVGIVSLALAQATGSGVLGVTGGVILGASAGAAAGRLVRGLAAAPWIATLCALIVLRLVGILIGGVALEVADPELDLLGTGAPMRVPVPVWIAAAVMASAWLVGRTRRGPAADGWPQDGTPLTLTPARPGGGGTGGRVCADVGPENDTPLPLTPARPGGGGTEWRHYAAVGAAAGLAGILVAVRAGSAQPIGCVGMSLDVLCAVALADVAGAWRVRRGAARSAADTLVGVSLMALILNVIAVAAWSPVARYAAHALILGSTYRLLHWSKPGIP